MWNVEEMRMIEFGRVRVGGAIGLTVVLVAALGAGFLVRGASAVGETCLFITPGRSPANPPGLKRVSPSRPHHESRGTTTRRRRRPLVRRLGSLKYIVDAVPKFPSNPPRILARGDRAPDLNGIGLIAFGRGRAPGAIGSAGG